jgi:hypothetical protein
MFTDTFKTYTCEGDSISCMVDGFMIRATIERDDCTGAPDKRGDGFWPSLDPKADGFIGEGKTQADLDIAQRQADEIMRAWRNDEWFYCGVCVRVSREGVNLNRKYENALWGVECNYPGTANEYLHTVANELLPEALDAARKVLVKLCEGVCK